MKLHDLRPADGSRTARTRVGRGIAAGKGKTAGRGTKGQKARAGGSIPPWFEGGQTPLHMRIPKLRGFKNRFKVEYEVVNIGRIGEAATLGAFDAGDAPGGGKSAKAAPATVNQEILRAVGLVRRLDRPMKVLGHGDIDVALFVVADKFSKSAVAKIEAAGGSVQVLEVPTEALTALGVEPKASGKAAKASPKPSEPRAAASAKVADEAAAEPVARPSRTPPRQLTQTRPLPPRPSPRPTQRPTQRPTLLPQRPLRRRRPAPPSRRRPPRRPRPAGQPRPSIRPSARPLRPPRASARASARPLRPPRASARTRPAAKAARPRWPRREPGPRPPTRPRTTRSPAPPRRTKPRPPKTPDP